MRRDSRNAGSAAPLVLNSAESEVLGEMRSADVQLGQIRVLHTARIAALVGVEPKPPVTRQVFAPGTCAVEVPRNCRTASVTRFRPWM